MANKEFGVISNPEFLQESTAMRDTIYPHVVVLGGYDTQFMRKSQRFFSNLHKNTPIIKTNHQTAEMIKYTNNSFLATKISFINQIASVCQNVKGANVDDVARVIGMDPRIGNLFLNAGPGYGGSCLPKDVKAMMNFSKKIGVEPLLLNAVEKSNVRQIEQIITIIKKTCGNLEGKKITILGLSFKPNTNDIRDSISLEIIKKLLRKKADIIVHDPMAIENVKKIFKDKIEYSTLISKALCDSYCAIILTAWPEYQKISNKDLRYMRKRIIIDSRRILNQKSLNCNYLAVGLGK